MPNLFIWHISLCKLKVTYFTMKDNVQKKMQEQKSHKDIFEYCRSISHQCHHNDTENTKTLTQSNRNPYAINKNRHTVIEVIEGSSKIKYNKNGIFTFVCMHKNVVHGLTMLVVRARLKFDFITLNPLQQLV